MPYNGKTNWQLNDTVMPEDMNRIESGIKSAASTADAAIPSNQKGKAGGVATLGVDGKVIPAQLPPAQEIPDATTNNKGIVKLSNSIDSQSQSEAATPKAVSDIKKSVDNQIALKANLVSPGLQGVPTVPTATKGTNTQQIASTAFVQVALEDKANLNAPTFTGYPRSTTPPTNDNSTAIATTAYVKAQMYDTLNTITAYMNADITLTHANETYLDLARYKHSSGARFSIGLNNGVNMIKNSVSGCLVRVGAQVTFHNATAGPKILRLITSTYECDGFLYVPVVGKYTMTISTVVDIARNGSIGLKIKGAAGDVIAHQHWMTFLSIDEL